MASVLEEFFSKFIEALQKYDEAVESSHREYGAICQESATMTEEVMATRVSASVKKLYGARNVFRDEVLELVRGAFGDSLEAVVRKKLGKLDS